MSVPPGTQEAGLAPGRPEGLHTRVTGAQLCAVMEWACRASEPWAPSEAGQLAHPHPAALPIWAAWVCFLSPWILWLL